MPWFRCTDPECGHTWFHRSILDETPECVECGELAEMFDPDDDEPETTAAHTTQPRIAYVREQARKRVADERISAPPVPVRELAESDGLTIVLRPNLGSLRGRLVGSTIELAKGDHLVVQRFTIAHELGHRALHHQHGDSSWAEVEADNYANELLVPGPMLREVMIRTRSATELRRLFEVSRPVLEIACKHHHLIAALTE
jgi:hypothetical protein